MVPNKDEETEEDSPEEEKEQGDLFVDEVLSDPEPLPYNPSRWSEADLEAERVKHLAD